MNYEGWMADFAEYAPFDAVYYNASLSAYMSYDFYRVDSESDSNIGILRLPTIYPTSIH